RSGRGHRGRRRPGFVRRLVSVVLAAGVVLVSLALAAVGYELALPGVGDAQARVAAILRVHQGTIGGLPVPSKLGEAVVAVEDEHFYSDVFLNVFDGAARAAVASLHTSAPGGSTIPQQLAKQLYANTSSASGAGATLEQIALGVKLALSYSKAEILAMYLNAIYYGNGYWGDVSAARGYFGVDPEHLTWAEAAMLAGLPQAPSAYDPEEHLALAKLRQRHVLERLVANHFLTEGQADAAYAAPLPLRNE
ncbi:MAG TPA: biosynthetic peptidoglycan transglycosylase, partial [Acidimicrobiales bacterium]|nr:biosynthetic peptidoglycan transglycosylase [Acidimicrobiales bacterium]